MSKIKKLIEKRQALSVKIRKLHTDKGDEAWTEEETRSWDQLATEHDQVEQSILREERLLQLDAEDNDLDAERRNLDENGETDIEQRRLNAFTSFMRTGVAEMEEEERKFFMGEQRANGLTPDSKGGFTVPKQFVNKLVETMKEFGGLANIATILPTDNGNSINWPVTDGTAEEGVMIAEHGKAGEEDITFSQVLLGAKKMTSKVILLSNELLNDTGIDMIGLVSRRAGTRIGRGEAKQLIQGSGSTTNVNGLKNQATVGVTAASVNAFTWEEMLKLKHSVDPAYRGTARWLFNDTVLLSIKLMKDTMNRPLWLPSITASEPATFDGDAYQIDQAMDSPAADKTPIMYGDFKSVIIRRVRYMSVKRLTEKYAENDQTAFVAFHRFDMVLEDLAAIRSLKMKAA